MLRCVVAHKRFVHGPPGLFVPVFVDTLEELVEGRVSFQLFVLLVGLHLSHQLVPVSSVVGGRWVFVGHIRSCICRTHEFRPFSASFKRVQDHACTEMVAIGIHTH